MPYRGDPPLRIGGIRSIVAIRLLRIGRICPVMTICPLRIRGICSVAAICMLQKQKSELFFFAIRDSLPPSQSRNEPFCGRFAAFLRRNPRFGAPWQSLIANKLHFGRIFVFEVPERLCRPNCSEAHLLAFRGWLWVGEA